MATIKDRVDWLYQWCGESTNRNYNEARRMAMKAKTFPFDLIRHGKSPLKEEYLAYYHILGKHPFHGTIMSVVMERKEGEPNPTLSFNLPCVNNERTSSFEKTCVVIKSHALDRYAERHLKKLAGYALSIEEITQMLLSKAQDGCSVAMVASVDNITNELTLKIEAGLFLGHIEKDGTHIINTFVADHNLYSNQSLGKRKMNDYHDKMNGAFDGKLQTKAEFMKLKRMMDK